MPKDPTRFQVMIIFAGRNVADFSVKLTKQYGKTPIDIRGRSAGRTDGKTCLFYTTDAP
jgi:hypothetical protein